MPAPRKPVEPLFLGNKPTPKKVRERKIRRVLSWLILILLGIAVYAVVATAAQPLFMIHYENSEISKLRKQVEAERTKKARLEDRKKWLSSPIGQQTELRKYGYVKEGEDPIRLPEPVKSEK